MGWDVAMYLLCNRRSLASPQKEKNAADARARTEGALTGGARGVVASSEGERSTYRTAPNHQQQTTTTQRIPLQAVSGVFRQ
eukprot:7418977-Alexandrium_andersonii.AAC.1